MARQTGQTTVTTNESFDVLSRRILVNITLIRRFVTTVACEIFIEFKGELVYTAKLIPYRGQVTTKTRNFYEILTWCDVFTGKADLSFR